jgi:hypothetical protein
MFRFGNKSNISIFFADAESMPKKTVSRGSDREQELLIFNGSEPVRGMVEIFVGPNQTLEHLGVKIELIGQIEMYYDRGNNFEFTSLVRELASQGVIRDTQRYEFDFSAVEKPYESYRGANVGLRYFIRVSVARNYSGNIVREQEFLVQNIQPPPEINNTIKMEVGIEDCLHIEFEYDKQKYHLQDVVLGKIYFLLVRIKIKHMELAIIRRESAGTGPNMYNESETITKFELMDGAPVRGECVPIRCFLSNYDLTPTYRSVSNKFSCKYYLNLVLVDEEDRRYFKQQEVTLWRQDIG